MPLEALLRGGILTFAHIWLNKASPVAKAKVFGAEMCKALTRKWVEYTAQQHSTQLVHEHRQGLDGGPDTYCTYRAEILERKWARVISLFKWRSKIKPLVILLSASLIAALERDSHASVSRSCLQEMMEHRLTLRTAAKKTESRIAASPAHPWFWRLSGDCWSSCQCHRLGLEQHRL